MTQKVFEGAQTEPALRVYFSGPDGMQNPSVPALRSKRPLAALRSEMHPLHLKTQSRALTYTPWGQCLQGSAAMWHKGRAKLYMGYKYLVQ